MTAPPLPAPPAPTAGAATAAPAATPPPAAAPLACSRCGTGNRSVARFCRACGAAVPALARDPFGQLLGLDDAVATMRTLVASVGALARAGSGRLRLHHLLLGRAGTGKSLLARALADACAQHGLTASPEPVRLGAAALLGERDVPALLLRHVGRVVVIDDAHQLTQPGAGGHGAAHPLARLLGGLGELPSDTDPVVVLAGHPGPLLEYLDGSPELRGRFPNVVTLPDLSPTTMRALAARELAAAGAALAPDADAPLFARARHLHDSTADEYVNGWAVRRDVERMLVRVARPRPGREPFVVHADDVPTPVHVPRTRDEILAELDAKVGMGPVRAFVEELLAKADAARARAQRAAAAGAAAGGAAVPPNAGLEGHVMLLGNPGTGKTTVARILARILGATGLLPTERLVEVDRGRLVAEHVGGTAKLVHQACDAAQGGVLFIDEAYDLWRGAGDQFGQEAVTTLLKRLEDDRGRFVCVVAGYAAEMGDWLKANPGLPRRFPYRFTLPDYTDAELAEIFRGMAKERGLRLAPGADEAVRAACRTLRARATKRFGNAGEVRNLLEVVERRAAARGRRAGADDGTITAADVAGDEASEVNVEAALAGLRAELDRFVGLHDVKQALVRLAAVMSIEREVQLTGGGRGAPAVHWLFAGNPGTGKTVVARLMGRFFRAMGLLPTDQVSEVKAEDLIGQYVGETKQKTSAAIDRAMGGVLFIDEAHQLAPQRTGTASFNREAIDVLLTRMENDRGKFVVIAAGYDRKLDELLAADPGMPSRFTRRLTFADYAPGELLEILRRSAAGAEPPLAYAAGVEEAFRARCEEAIAARGATYGNGRFARKLLDATIENQRVRLSELRAERPLTPADLSTLLVADVPDSALPLV